MTTLGFVVLAKRPAPRTEHGWTYDTFSPIYPTLEAAQDGQKYHATRPPKEGVVDSVEYVVGEIVPVTPSSPLCLGCGEPLDENHVGSCYGLT